MLFDLDGTLIDSLADLRASANHLRAAFGLPPVSAEIARTWVGDGVFKLMERSLAELGPFEPLRDRAWRIYSEHHIEQCTALVRPYSGVREHLARWRSGGRSLAVVTNKQERFVTKILAHLELSDFFAAVICGDTLAVKKPDPEPVREALRRIGGAAAQALMVGDSLQDLRAGKAAGVRTAAVLFGFTDPALLRAEGADEYWVEFGVQ
jgi:phosphoglycolate phosphatase